VDYNSIFRKKIFYNLYNMKNKQECLTRLIRSKNKVNNSLTAYQLNELALKLSFYFLTNFKNKNQIIVSMEPSIEFVITILACIYSKKTFIPLKSPKSDVEKQRFYYILNDLGTSIIFTDKKNYNNLLLYHLSELEKLELLDLARIESFHCDVSDIEKSFIYLEKILENIKYENVVIQFTSGTTANPKGVKIAAKNILSNYDNLSKRWRFKKDKNFLTWLPTFHDMGLFSIIHCFFLTGMKTYLMTPEDFIKNPLKWLEAISINEIYISGAPPFAYEMCIDLLKDNDLESLNFSKWKLAFCGADYVSHSMMEKFRMCTKKYNFDENSLFATYGMAEATLFVLGEPFWENKSFKKLSKESQSEGCFFPEENSKDLLILDTIEYTKMCDGQKGEILISGDNVSKSYISKDMDSLLIDGNQWYKTGDIGYIENNCLFITGRKKSLIKIYGKGIDVNDIIDTLSNNINEINRYSSLVFKDTDFSNSLIIVLELKKKMSFYQKEFIGSLREKISVILFEEFGLSAKRIILLSRGSLPKTTSGKIQHNKIELLYKEGKLNNE